MYMTGTIVIVLLLLAAICLLRLRVRFELGTDRRLLFVGLGRSGPEFDFVRRVQSFKLFGRTIKSAPMRKPDEKAAPKPEKPAEADDKRTEKKSKRVRPWHEVIGIIPKCTGALQRYSFGLLKSVVVEELDAQIEAGFEQPDLTGQLFGYYQAALAAVPSVVGRVQYQPDWTGASFAGSARLAVALPLYRLLYRTFLLICQLPLRRLIKLAIGKKRGGQDG
jgi:hypothetical protein